MKNAGRFSDMRREGRLMLIGIIVAACATLLPLFSAITLLLDANYIFWRGYRFPLEVIGICFFAMTVVIVSCWLIHKRSPVDGNHVALALVGSVSTALLGLLLILVTMPAQQDILAVATQLRTGCSTPGPDVIMLSNFHQVLSNIRSAPACNVTEHSSVEFCDGWAENSYTSYLRSMEHEFQCGPLCPAVQAVQAQPVLLSRRKQAHHRRHGLLNALQRGEHEKLLDNKLERDHSPHETTKLFGRGLTRMACLPLVATHLEVLAWHCHTVVFWEVFLLVAASVFVKLGSVCRMNLCNSPGSKQ
jgi:hypothetical protein